MTTRLTNAVDEALVRRGMLAPDQVRRCDADALIDTGAVRVVVPPHIALRWGWAFAVSEWPSPPWSHRGRER